MEAGIAVDNRDDARNTPLHLAAGEAHTVKLQMHSALSSAQMHCATSWLQQDLCASAFACASSRDQWCKTEMYSVFQIAVMLDTMCCLSWPLGQLGTKTYSQSSPNWDSHLLYGDAALHMY